MLKMKPTIQTTLILSLLFSPSLRAAEFLAATTSPKITIDNIERNAVDPNFLTLTVTVGATGKGQLALNQEQFTVSISTKNKASWFSAHAVFPELQPKNFLIVSGKPQVIKIQISKDRFGKKESWRQLPDGNYQIQVRLNSGKSKEFDFQWLGQTYSKSKNIKLPIPIKPIKMENKSQ
jgi:hypothetical protein